VYGAGLEHLRISPAEFAEFLGTVFPVWWRHRADFGVVEPFASLVRKLAGQGRALTCTEAGACASSHLSVRPDGSASHCGRSADWGLLDYGSIRDRSFSQIFADSQREVLRQRVAVLPDTECQDCRVWDFCHGGCPLDAWFARGSFLHKSGWCQAQKELIETYIEPLVVGDSAGSVERRRATLP